MKEIFIEIELVLEGSAGEPEVLRGRYASDVGGNVYSRATTKWHR